MKAVFLNRPEAGSKLAQKLIHNQHHTQTIVLELARSGVSVAYEVAKGISLPLNVCLVKKLSLPDEIIYRFKYVREE